MHTESVVINLIFQYDQLSISYQTQWVVFNSDGFYFNSIQKTSPQIWNSLSSIV